VHVEVSKRPWRRWFAAVFTVASACCVLAACGKPGSPTANAAAPVSSAGTAIAPVALKAVYLAQVRAKVLVDGAGFSLYVFGPDRRRDVSCTATCALSWPPLTVSAGTKPSTGPGVEAGLVGITSTSGGADVVTYDRWPLYTYVADVSPGMDSGQGINLNGGPWYLMQPDGQPLVPAGQPRLLGAPWSSR
jgi:predicted lipoprotein with Yx(FWY)xxD motif